MDPKEWTESQENRRLESDEGDATMSKARRTHSAEFKTQVVLAYLSGEKTVAELCREHQLKDTLVYRWKDEFLARASQVFEPEKRETSEAAERIAALERLAGRLALENDILKKANSIFESRRRNGEP